MNDTENKSENVSEVFPNWVFMKKINLYEKRWFNAVKVATKINNLLDTGHFIFNEVGERVLHKFKITDMEVLLPMSDSSSILYFMRDKEYDNGAYTKISDYNAQFNGWKAVHPDNVFLINL